MRAAGISTLNTLEMMQFEKLAGLQMTQVPYKGGAGPGHCRSHGRTMST